MGRYPKIMLLVILDLFLLAVALLGACYLSGYTLHSDKTSIAGSLAVVVILQLVVFLRFGFYRAVLRYASIDFLISVVKGVSIAILVVMIGFYITQVQVPIRVLIVDWFLTIAFVGGSRFLVRYYFELRQRYQRGRRVLIYGAGDMGELAIRQLLRNKNVLYSPIGFVDDDAKKIGAVIRGVRVLGSLNDLDVIADNYRIEEVVVAIAEIGSDKLGMVVKKCRQKDIICRIIPCFSRLVEIEPDIRNVELADLMRRSPRDLDKDTVEKYIKGKNVLISGAAGSIGSEIVRQCLQFSPKSILALDKSEYGLYALKEDLGSDGSEIQYLLGDISNRNRIEKILQSGRPDIIFHAAAYKHVPLLEANPTEGIRNNILGTKNLCELADKYKVSSFVMISTDKAVRPSSVMGATKRICELLVQNFDKRSNTEYVAVRFGNVLGSSGSVVPKFIGQIRKGGPVTVTHPDATRYFMLIDEAVQLVLQAAAIGKGGEIFILDMGKPVKIKDLAEDLIYLMGRRPHKDVQIDFCGLRPGEKIHEELFNDEIEKPTKFSEITIGKPKLVEWEWLNTNIDSLLEYTKNNLVECSLEMMGKIISEGDFQVKTTVTTNKEGWDNDIAMVR